MTFPVLPPLFLMPILRFLAHSLFSCPFFLPFNGTAGNRRSYKQCELVVLPWETVMGGENTGHLCCCWGSPDRLGKRKSSESERGEWKCRAARACCQRASCNSTELQAETLRFFSVHFHIDWWFQGGFLHGTSCGNTQFKLSIWTKSLLYQ